MSRRRSLFAYPQHDIYQAALTNSVTRLSAGLRSGSRRCAVRHEKPRVRVLTSRRLDRGGNCAAACRTIALGVIYRSSRPSGFAARPGVHRQWPNYRCEVLSAAAVRKIPMGMAEGGQKKAVAASASARTVFAISILRRFFERLSVFSGECGVVRTTLMDTFRILYRVRAVQAAPAPTGAANFFVASAIPPDELDVKPKRTKIGRH